MLKRRYIRLKEPLIFLTITGLITTFAHMAIPACFYGMAIFFKADELSNWTCISRQSGKTGQQAERDAVSGGLILSRLVYQDCLKAIRSAVNI